MLPTKNNVIPRTQLSRESELLGSEEEEPKPCSVEGKLTKDDLTQTMEDIEYFSRASVFKGVKQSINIQQKTNKFVTKIKAVLKSIEHLKTDDDQLHNVFIFVLQSATDYLYMMEQEPRDELCVDILCQFTKSDRKLCKCIIKMLSCKVKKSTFLRRNKRQIYKVFLTVLNMFVRRI